MNEIKSVREYNKIRKSKGKQTLGQSEKVHIIKDINNVLSWNGISKEELLAMINEYVK